MKLSDIMGAADLAIYAEVGLVLFMGAFLAVTARVLLTQQDDEYENAPMIPLSQEPVVPRSRGESQEGER